MAPFPFSDLHGFKDFVGFVRLCAPDLFPEREGLRAESQWTLDLAFQGLDKGLALAIDEKGNRPQFERVRQLFEAALKAYRMSDNVGGSEALAEAQRILRRVPSE